MLSQSLKKERKTGPNITGYHFPRISAFLPSCESICWLTIFGRAQWKKSADGDRISLQAIAQDSWWFHAHLWTTMWRLYATQRKTQSSDTVSIITFVCLSSKAAAEEHNERTSIHRLLHPVAIYYYLHDTEEGLSGQSRLHLVALFVYFSNLDDMFALVLSKHSIADVIFRWLLTGWP